MREQYDLFRAFRLALRIAWDRVDWVLDSTTALLHRSRLVRFELDEIPRIL